jgi:hypothetical protein
MTARAAALALALPLSVVLSACSPKETHWESVCQIVSRTPVTTETDGTVTLVDMELEWDPCPGDQFQVLRGGKDFAACTSKMKEGQYVPVHVVHYWDARGYYRWALDQVGDCKLDVQVDAPGSFEKGQACQDIVFHGRKAGFRCSRKADKSLVSICPWMARE